MAKVCPKCNKTSDEGIKFCLECGTPLGEAETLAENQAEPRKHEQQLDQEAIRSILAQLSSSIESVEGHLKAVSDTNLLLLRKLHELEAKLEASSFPAKKIP